MVAVDANTVPSLVLSRHIDDKWFTDYLDPTMDLLYP